jgi:hypothetical protein
MNYQSKHIKGVPYFATSNNVNQVINMLDQLIFDLQAELTALSNSSLYIGSNVALFPTSGITINKLGIDTSTRKLYSFNGVTWNQVTISNDGNVPVNVVPPTIDVFGEIVIGGDVGVSDNGTWTSDTGIISYEYQWYRDGVEIVGAIFDGYVITIDDVDTNLTCKVIAIDSDGASLPATSNQILIATVPISKTLPIISGVLIVGQVLTTDDGVWGAVGAITYSYQWKRNGSNIVAETASTYTLVQADAGQNITCEVTATTLAGSASATSAGSSILATILDITGNAKGAYSSYLLRGAYYGSPLVRVRRSGDSSEFDFGVTTAGILDTSALVAFCVAGGGAQSGFIVKIYDQSGQGNHLTQTTPSDQLAIVTSGVLLTTNSRVAFRSLSTDFLTVPSSTNTFKFLHDGTDSLVYGITKTISANTPLLRTMTTSATSSIGYWFGENSGNRLNSLIGNGGGVAFSVNNTSATSTTTTGSQMLIFDKIDANNATAANRSAMCFNNGAEIKNNTNTASVSSSASSSDLRVITGPTQEFQELVIYDIQPSITTIKTNVNSRFNIY